MTALKTLITTLIVVFWMPCNAYANDPAVVERITALRKKPMLPQVLMTSNIRR